MCRLVRNITSRKEASWIEAMEILPKFAPRLMFSSTFILLIKDSICSEINVLGFFSLKFNR
jgi:hypothetical protein